MFNNSSFIPFDKKSNSFINKLVCLNKWSKKGVDDFRDQYVENGFNEGRVF